MSNTLIRVAELRALLDDPGTRILDCRFQLGRPSWGREQYQQRHLPGAYYADLEGDLSDMQAGAAQGRHPLPDPAAFARFCARLGLPVARQIVCYDQDDGLWAARAWWLLRAIGLKRVAVLEGGYRRWVLEGGETTTQLPELHSEEAVPLRWRQMPWLDTPALEHGLRGAELIVLDARSPERYRGEVEPLDPVAGHIPGALNRPCSANLDAGLFKSAAELRREFETLLDGRPPAAVVHSCGSGVTACHNLLAMEHAGLPGSRLYPPSYSGWVADPERRAAVERGG
jgi:thiosulfate/3-mercaptopyruvate sulfurtransferase